ncbi:VWA domain-containing protein [Oscillatoria sp. FACHB-1407]|uniref:VWA domain-containing protein n=1 Tax=Oscillatoria sp. FACHB-1407 TaxID=2692847 RepID=UPI001689BAEE|nr:VWA domain-containing protein [Oscillatoria sp. FACHB-1407]MBD2464666.1 VWA domain-containing protein [Oscillatoria sp. FACHB-1407]
MTDFSSQKRLRRWRLILGGGAADGICAGADGDERGGSLTLSDSDRAMDKALAALYESQRGSGAGFASPQVARWLGDIRTYFPTSVVRVMQQDALERLNLQRLLLEPEMLEAVEPDVHLLSNLLSLNAVMPAKVKETARIVVRRVVDDLLQKLANPTRQAIMGSLNRAVRNRRPRHHEIDWQRTIRANLKHYQPDYRTIIPERRIGYGRKRSSLQDIILCVDQSGSMLSSMVYAGVFSCVLASLPAVRTRLVAYDTEVVDLSDLLQDPIEVLFGTQLGGGNDTPKALAYCQKLIQRPQETIFVLISDLYEGPGSEEMIKRLGTLVSSGVQVITLFALNDDGSPAYDHDNAHALAKLGIPAFACTPDLFPDLMAAAINRQDLTQWAATQEIAIAQ